ncbi:sirohydrochlorin chelatase [Paenibacillus ginsengarvi]|uniref:Cobalamin biosynthesis protein CbiX n=1 Tax=Paenibacillus ginsengarvi TaxID=400777 RepID=A0A3B0CHB5_9BACL|nr:CbiX/SirB N-terminal domain-containing protein [Paenibacillus ginsengarvi]RKN84044.1 cobalamin biosynthesis protein CbiX [Paenibacillus ginsengarvi]
MSKAGVLIISHGSRSAEWIRLIDRAVAAVAVPPAWDGPVPVVSSFLELVEGRLIQDGIDALEAQGVTDIVVVPLFVSYGSTHVDEIRYALGDLPEPSFDSDLKPFRLQGAVHMCPPLDDDPVVADMVYDHLCGVTGSPQRQNVVLIGHGSELPQFYARWKSGMGRVAERLQRLGGYAGVRTALLLPDEARNVVALWQEEEPDRDIVIAPLFLSSGYFTNTVIPQRLAGLRYLYNGKALLPHPSVSRWIERQAAEKLRNLEKMEQKPYRRETMPDGGVGRWRNAPD